MDPNTITSDPLLMALAKIRTKEEKTTKSSKNKEADRLKALMDMLLGRR